MRKLGDGVSALTSDLAARPTVTSPVLPGLRHVSPEAETLLLTFLGVFVSILIACAVSNALAQSFAGGSFSYSLPTSMLTTRCRQLYHWRSARSVRPLSCSSALLKDRSVNLGISLEVI